MNIRFYSDIETGLPHIYNHGVTEDEVEEVLLNPSERRSGDRRSKVVIGQTQSGRYLRIVYVEDRQPNSVFVVTVYELRGKPLTAYRRRQRRKGR